MTTTRALLEFAMEAAWQAGRSTLAHFQTGVSVEQKSDASPVTAADRGAEEILRRLIAERFPGHAVVGEEYGSQDKDSPYRWIIDPIDGTRSFIRGVPLYGTLLGLEIQGETAVGVAYFPALDEMVAAARGEGCTWNGRPARVSSTGALEDALVSYTDHRDLATLWPSFWKRVQAETALQRGFSDCYGHALVATGRADMMLDAVMGGPWDCAALLPILQEAGGTFTDWQGVPRIDGGNALSTNGLLFEPLMELLRTSRSA